MQLKDQINNSVTLSHPAERIISLVPSQTELLYDLGLENEVVGITKFCVHPPEWRKEKTIIGGTKNHQMDKIRNLKPDLIIANKEENTKALVEKLAKDFPTYVSDISSLEHSYQMMEDVGRLTGKMEETSRIISEIKESFTSLRKIDTPLKVAYCIWKDPFMWAGEDTFIHHLLVQCGLINIIDQSRYPKMAINDVFRLRPDVIMLSSEPFPFKQKHVAEIKQEYPEAKVLLVDGEMFSWYGSRLIKAVPYFSSLLRQLDPYTS